MEVENQISILETKHVFQSLYVSQNHPKVSKSDKTQIT